MSAPDSPHVDRTDRRSYRTDRRHTRSAPGRQRAAYDDGPATGVGPDGPGRKAVVLAGLLTFVAAVATYWDILPLFFPGLDSIAHVDASRLRSLADFGRVFTERIQAGATQDWGYFRPLSTLSYSLDYAVWGLDPFGFQLTNLLLHAGTTAAVFWLALELLETFSISVGSALAKGSSWPQLAAATLAALLFTLHPILVESVPAPDRRHDIITSLLLTSGLALFLRGLRARDWKKVKSHSLLAGALVLFILGLLAKESAAVFPVLLVACVALYDRSGVRSSASWGAAIRRGLRLSAPFWICLAVFFVWRLRIVGGLGGVSWIEDAESVLHIPVVYFADLIYVVHALGLDTDRVLEPGTGKALASFLIGGAILIALAREWLQKHERFRLPADASEVARGGGQALLALASLVLVVYPSSLVLIHLAHEGVHVPLLSGVMEGREVVPESRYLSLASSVLLSWAGFIFSVAACLYVLGWLIDGKRRALSLGGEALDMGMVALLWVWLCLPLGLYFVVSTFAHRLMYFPAIPWSILIAVAIVTGISTQIPRRRKQASVSDNGSRAERTMHGRIGGLVFWSASVLAVAVAATSPAFRTYDGWAVASNVSREVLGQLEQSVEDAPGAERLRVWDLPQGDSAHERTFPEVSTASYLADYTVESWLRLRLPRRSVDVVACRKVILPDEPSAIETNVEEKSQDLIDATISFQFPGLAGEMEELEPPTEVAHLCRKAGSGT